MENWHFVLWTSQYLIGFVIAMLISVYIFRKFPKSRAYQYFLVFGLSISLWAIFTFLHRNAPTAELSKDAFRAVMFLSSTVQASILLSILYIEKKKRYYPLLTLPLFALGTIMAVLAPYTMNWTDYGWSYSFNSPWLSVFSAFNMIYLLITAVILAVKIKRSLVSVLRKKYIVFLVGYGGFYGAGMGITNMQIAANSGFPPLGGLLLTAAFLIVAYGMTLSAKKIEIKELGKVDNQK